MWRWLNGRTVPAHFTGAAPAVADTTLSSTPPNVGTFSTVQSLFSFSGATGGITLVSQVIPKVVLGYPTLPFLCGIAGLLIWLFNITDSRVSPRPTKWDMFFAFWWAVVNSIQLYLACLGLRVTIVGG
jgi:hypothetical protein